MKKTQASFNMDFVDDYLKRLAHPNSQIMNNSNVSCENFDSKSNRSFISQKIEASDRNSQKNQIIRKMLNTSNEKLTNNNSQTPNNLDKLMDKISNLMQKHDEIKEISTSKLSNNEKSSVFSEKSKDIKSKIYENDEISNIKTTKSPGKANLTLDFFKDIYKKTPLKTPKSPNLPRIIDENEQDDTNLITLDSYIYENNLKEFLDIAFLKEINEENNINQEYMEKIVILMKYLTKKLSEYHLKLEKTPCITPFSSNIKTNKAIIIMTLEEIKGINEILKKIMKKQDKKAEEFIVEIPKNYEKKQGISNEYGFLMDLDIKNDNDAKEINFKENQEILNENQENQAENNEKPIEMTEKISKENTENHEENTELQHKNEISLENAKFDENLHSEINNEYLMKNEDFKENFEEVQEEQEQEEEEKEMKKDDKQENINKNNDFIQSEIKVENNELPLQEESKEKEGKYMENINQTNEFIKEESENLENINKNNEFIDKEENNEFIDKEENIEKNIENNELLQDEFKAKEEKYMENVVKEENINQNNEFMQSEIKGENEFIQEEEENLANKQCQNHENENLKENQLFEENENLNEIQELPVEFEENQEIKENSQNNKENVDFIENRIENDKKSSEIIDEKKENSQNSIENIKNQEDIQQNLLQNINEDEKIEKNQQDINKIIENPHKKSSIFIEDIHENSQNLENSTKSIKNQEQNLVKDNNDEEENLENMQKDKKIIENQEYIQNIHPFEENKPEVDDDNDFLMKNEANKGNIPNKEENIENVENNVKIDNIISEKPLNNDKNEELDMENHEKSSEIIDKYQKNDNNENLKVIDNEEKDNNYQENDEINRKNDIFDQKNNENTRQNENNDDEENENIELFNKSSKDNEIFKENDVNNDAHLIQSINNNDFFKENKGNFIENAENNNILKESMNNSMKTSKTEQKNTNKNKEEKNNINHEEKPNSDENIEIDERNSYISKTNIEEKPHSFEKMEINGRNSFNSKKNLITNIENNQRNSINSIKNHSNNEIIEEKHDLIMNYNDENSLMKKNSIEKVENDENFAKIPNSNDNKEDDKNMQYFENLNENMEKIEKNDENAKISHENLNKSQQRNEIESLKRFSIEKLLKDHEKLDSYEEKSHREIDQNQENSPQLNENLQENPQNISASQGILDNPKESTMNDIDDNKGLCNNNQYKIMLKEETYKYLQQLYVYAVPLMKETIENIEKHQKSINTPEIIQNTDEFFEEKHKSNEILRQLSGTKANIRYKDEEKEEEIEENHQNEENNANYDYEMTPKATDKQRTKDFIEEIDKNSMENEEKLPIFPGFPDENLQNDNFLMGSFESKEKIIEITEENHRISLKVLEDPLKNPEKTEENHRISLKIIENPLENPEFINFPKEAKFQIKHEILEDNETNKNDIKTKQIDKEIPFSQKKPNFTRKVHSHDIISPFKNPVENDKNLGIYQSHNQIVKFRRPILIKTPKKPLNYEENSMKTEESPLKSNIVAPNSANIIKKHKNFIRKASENHQMPLLQNFQERKTKNSHGNLSFSYKSSTTPMKNKENLNKTVEFLEKSEKINENEQNNEKTLPEMTKKHVSIESDTKKLKKTNKNPMFSSKPSEHLPKIINIKSKNTTLDIKTPENTSISQKNKAKLLNVLEKPAESKLFLAIAKNYIKKTTMLYKNKQDIEKKSELLDKLLQKNKKSLIKRSKSAMHKKPENTNKSNKNTIEAYDKQKSPISTILRKNEKFTGEEKTFLFYKSYLQEQKGF